MEDTQYCRAVIITALPVEYKSVLPYLSNIVEKTHQNGTKYTAGLFKGKKVIWDILVSEVGKGNQNSAQETERAIAFHKPVVALLVGIAGGIKDVAIGDVVAADKIYYYESGKWTPDGKFYSRPTVYNSGYKLVEQAKALAREEKRQSLLDITDCKPESNVIIGPIASGECVVASTNSEPYELIKQNFNDSIALAMEDTGFSRAVYANPDVQGIVIRGISDLLNNKTDTGQDFAAKNAVEFAFQILNAIELKIYPYFEAAPHEFRLTFDTLMADKLDRFVGRGCVFDKIDKFLMDNDSGYFVICGVPGIGKSALMAKLVNDRGYIHHFNIASQNIRNISQFLENISSQLVSRYKLDFQRIPSNLSDNSALLSMYLNEAAKKRKDEKIIIAIDALDESDRSKLAPEVNALYLPTSLPKGVYIVISTRPLEDLRLNVARIKKLVLVPESDYNMKDISRYIKLYTQQPRMQDRLEKINKTSEEFIKIVRNKSQGNFMYLYYVLPAFEQGKFNNGSLDELPDGLEEYYNRHWRQMQDITGKEKFEKIYEPIVYTLSVVKEPVSIQSITYFTKLEERDVRNAIRYWREFLCEQRSEGITKYRIYHPTFQEFLREKTDLTEYHKILAELGFQNLLALGIIKNKD